MCFAKRHGRYVQPLGFRPGRIGRAPPTDVRIQIQRPVIPISVAGTAVRSFRPITAEEHTYNIPASINLFYGLASPDRGPVGRRAGSRPTLYA